jgi:hypothetical protein
MLHHLQHPFFTHSQLVELYNNTFLYDQLVLPKFVVSSYAKYPNIEATNTNLRVVVGRGELCFI